MWFMGVYRTWEKKMSGTRGKHAAFLRHDGTKKNPIKIKLIFTKSNVIYIQIASNNYDKLCTKLTRLSENRIEIISLVILLRLFLVLLRLRVAHPSYYRHDTGPAHCTHEGLAYSPSHRYPYRRSSTSKESWHLWRLGLAGRCVHRTLLSGQCARSLDLHLLRELAGSTLSAPSDASRPCTPSLTNTSPRQADSCCSLGFCFCWSCLGDYGVWGQA